MLKDGSTETTIHMNWLSVDGDIIERLR